jgi:hypothetical protein
MTGLPSGVPPPKEAAAPAGTRAADEGKGNDENGKHNSTNDADSLLKKALSVMPGGDLYEFLPKEPSWYRSIGYQVHRWFRLQQVQRAICRSSTPAEMPARDRKRLEFVYQLAERRRLGGQIGPAYPPRTHTSIEEGRTALADGFTNVLAETLAYYNSITRKAAYCSTSTPTLNSFTTGLGPHARP